ncbi:hypothetical protein ACI65C_001359 [Semiaphis heraclei]
MKGRKPAVPSNIVVEAVLQFKDRVIITDNGEKRIAAPSADVWSDISSYLNDAMSKIAIYTLVCKGRHEIKEKLGLVFKNVTVETPSIPHVTNYESGLVLMHCLYIGNFNEAHSKFNKKRRLIGPARERALTSIIDKNIACETYREKEAHRLMKIALKGSSLIRSAKNEIYHLPPIRHNAINSTPKITTTEVLEGGASGTDNEEMSDIEIFGDHNDKIHESVDSQNIMVDDMLIATLNDEIMEEKNIMYKTYPSYNVDKLFIDFPSLQEVTECSSDVCLNTSYINYNFITMQTDMESNIGELQQYLNDRTNIII